MSCIVLKLGLDRTVGPAGRTGRTGNRWVGRFEPTFGSAMQLTRPEPVKTGDSAEFLSDRFSFFFFKPLPKRRRFGFLNKKI